jgi:hypothetical protein
MQRILSVRRQRDTRSARGGGSNRTSTALHAGWGPRECRALQRVTLFFFWKSDVY